MATGRDATDVAIRQLWTLPHRRPRHHRRGGDEAATHQQSRRLTMPQPSIHRREAKTLGLTQVVVNINRRDLGLRHRNRDLIEPVTASPAA